MEYREREFGMRRFCSLAVFLIPFNKLINKIINNEGQYIVHAEKLIQN